MAAAGQTVTVLLPCLNAEAHVRDAVQSVLQQTYRGLELLALDDGSTDSTLRILRELGAQDARIRVLHSRTNQGLVTTLNRGVSEARGEMVARMDADDLSAPRRIELQVAHLSARPEIDVVGGAITLEDEHGQRLRPRPVRCLEPAGTSFMALLGTPVAHVTILARTETMRAHPYLEAASTRHTEDYELFARMTAAGVRLANLDIPLVTVRARAQGVSLANERAQVENFVRCARAHFERTQGWLPAPGAHRVLVNRIASSTTPRDLLAGLSILDRLECEHLARSPESAEEIRAVAGLQRADIVVQGIRRGSPALRTASFALGLRYARQLLSPAARRYLLGKLPQGSRYWQSASDDSARSYAGSTSDGAPA